MSVDDELYHLARLTIEGNRRDVEMYVHRLAYRYRNTPLGVRLATVDVLPGVSLRSADTPTERHPACVAAWPECAIGGYDPRCCRFPKSCSCEALHPTETSAS